MTLEATLFTDPACPWGYSANPDLTVLRWRYGQAIDWRIVMIGLAETPDRYLEAGYTPTRMVKGYDGFRRRFGMPFQAAPKARVVGTGRACRAVVAVRHLAPELEWDAVRALQFSYFTSARLMDEDASIADALELVEGLDAARVVEQIDDPATESAYQQDRAAARTAEGGPTHFQGKSANTDGTERFTAPSVVFSTGAATLEAGGFQSLAVYDAMIANLDRTLVRRAPATEALEVLKAFPQGVTTHEVAAVMAPSLTDPDRAQAESALLDLVADGHARRTALGDDALWRIAR